MRDLERLKTAFKARMGEMEAAVKTRYAGWNDAKARAMLKGSLEDAAARVIAEKLVERLKEDFGRNSKIEGKDQGDWVLIDTQDVIVHVFRPEVREFYQLEKMWMPSGAHV